jgi:assimilatory nitrate reductase catalytic subunit
MESPAAPIRNSLVRHLAGALRRHTGPLTRQLELAPGGAGLGLLPANRVPEATAGSVCGFCSTGCGLRIHLRDGRAVGLSPDPDYPVNLGHACPKGWEALAVLDSSERATTPLLRSADGMPAPVDWDTALRTFVERFRSIQQRHGPDSLAFLSSGQIMTEEMALLGAVARFGMGIVHGDGNTRQCMATAATAYKESLGFDSPPFTYADFEESDVIILVGSNLCIAHPIMWQRICRKGHQPHIVVIDPRRTETAQAATCHVALRPKSDLVLFYGLAAILIERGWIDRDFIAAHTSGFAEYARHVAAFTPAVTTAATGLAVERLEDLAGIIHRGRRVSFWWTMGVNQSHEGVRVAQAIINLALLTGNIGRPGTGANSITGQCNAMGSRLYSNTTNLFGGRAFENAGDRRDAAAALGLDEAVIPDRPSWSYDRIIQGVADGVIKGLWIIGTNPAHSWIGLNDFDRHLSRLEFLVVQDMYRGTRTAARADLFLPAAGWGEKEGTFINSERRLGLSRKVCPAPGQALADFAIFQLVAEYWGCGDMFRHWDSPEAVFRLLQRVSAGRPCDITGIAGYRMLDEQGGVQWPWTAADAAAGAPGRERRLFADGRFFHPDGRARFCFEAPRPLPEPPDTSYPLLLLTGRGSATQWHTRTRSGQSSILARLQPREPYVEVHPDDAGGLGIADGDWVVIESRRGRVRARAVLTACLQPGQVFIPMHDDQTNRLTISAFDPYSRQPAYKACAVRLRRAGREHP